MRRKGRYIGETFRRHKDAEEWALAMERRIDRGETPSTRVRRDPTTFGDLVDLHLADLEGIGKCARRSKAFTLDSLKAKLGRVGISHLDRERLIAFGKAPDPPYRPLPTNEIIGTMMIITTGMMTRGADNHRQI